MDRAEYEAWKKSRQAEGRRQKDLKKDNQAYDPRAMKVGMPIGCKVMVLGAAALLLYLVSRLFFA